MNWYTVVLRNDELRAAFDCVLVGLFDKLRIDSGYLDNLAMYFVIDENPRRTFYLSSPSYDLVRGVMMPFSGSSCVPPDLSLLDSVYNSEVFMDAIARARKPSSRL
jgi:hypothetical protein